MRKNVANPELNGVPPKPAKKPRTAKARNPRQDVLNAEAKQEDRLDQSGRRASSVLPVKVTYLAKPWVPFGCLTLVAGQPQTGKSSFGAWLMKEAQCSAILPGYEESVATATVPRLKANGVNLDFVLLLDDREYRLPRDKKRIAESMKSWGAVLLILDPIDSYLEDGKSENSGADVREMLEAVSWIAEKTGAAVVGIRHPGKDIKNIMPGSRAWRAVPRSVNLLGMDSSFPPKRFISHDKDSFGNDAPPHRFYLDGEPGKPREFVMGDSLDASIVSLSREASDPTDRHGVKLAGMIARRLFDASPEPSVQEWKDECQKNGVSDRERRTAYHLLNIYPKPGSVGGKWIMLRDAKDWPSWTDEKQKSIEEGVSL